MKKNGLIFFVMLLAIIIIVMVAFYLQKNQTRQNNNEIKQNITKTDTKNQDSKDNSGDNPEEIKIFNISGVNFQFSQKEIKINQGNKVRVVFTSNEGFHDWVIDEFDAKSDRVNTGESTTVEFTVNKIGTFEYYCSVGNHRQLGMVGKLIVEERENINKDEGDINNVEKITKYKIKFLATWSLDTNPDNYPAGAHFSPFIAYSHNNSTNAKIFDKGETPTLGVEEMSESGETGALIKEIQNIIDVNYAYTQTKGNRIDSPGNDSSELDLSQDYSYITFVSMLAPSPDWFVSASANLFQNGQWIEKIELKLVTYDSGGDDGEEFTSKDQDSNPKQVITTFNKNLQNLGKIILTKI